MTTLSSRYSDPITPTPDDELLAQESSRQLARLCPGQRKTPVCIRVQADDATEELVSIPASAFRLLKDILTQMSQGNSIGMIPIHAELSTQEAADFLHVSRPWLVAQLEAGAIPFHKVGTHRRILFQDVKNFKEAIDTARLKTLEELSALDQELGLGY